MPRNGATVRKCRRSAHGLLLAQFRRRTDREAHMTRQPFLALATALLLSATAAAAGDDARLVDAARRGDWRSTFALVTAGSDVNARHADGSTALSWAVYHDALEAVDRLIAAGANVNAANEYGETPL